MTQIRKAFERAIQDAALSNFQTIFRKALNETVEENISKELKTLTIPELNSSNIPSLQPKTLFHVFVNGTRKAIEDMFLAACRKAKIQAYNASYKKVCEQALTRMEDQDFRRAQNEIITDFLALKGSPKVIILMMSRIIECFFAKDLLNRLINTYEEHANEEFSTWLDTAAHESATTAFLAIVDELITCPADQCKVNFFPYVLTELNRVRTQDGDTVVFNNAIKHTYGAFLKHNA